MQVAHLGATSNVWLNSCIRLPYRDQDGTLAILPKSQVYHHGRLKIGVNG